jgi:hypothetical protein
MAKKSRRGRRERRGKVAKQPTTVQSAQQAETLSGSGPAQDALEFTEEYHYVYTDVRTLLVVTIIMIALMYGLSYLV